MKTNTRRGSDDIFFCFSIQYNIELYFNPIVFSYFLCVLIAPNSYYFGLSWLIKQRLCRTLY